MNDRNKLLAVQLALVVGVCFFFFFFGLGAFGLPGADEPRYAQIAREMLARHDWIVPTLNGAPWLEKPVLLYWKMMNSYSLFGVSDWAARIPAAAQAMALVLGIFFFMRRFRFASELDAAMIAASSAGMIGFGRGASTDMLVSAPFALAMMCWWTWRQTSKKLWLVMFYGLLGVGALAKGPVAPALAVLVVGAYAVLQRDGKIFLRSLSIPALFCFLSLCCPGIWRCSTMSRNSSASFLLSTILSALAPIFTSTRSRSGITFLFFCWRRCPGHFSRCPRWSMPVKMRSSDGGLKTQRSIDAAAVADDGLIQLSYFSGSSFRSSSSAFPGQSCPATSCRRFPQPRCSRQTISIARDAVSRMKIALHALLCAILMVGALMAPFAMVKQAPPLPLQIGMMVTGAVIAVMVLVMVRREGVRVLHFVTLVPTILAVAFLLRPAAATIDRTQSARPINQRLTELGAATEPVASLQRKTASHLWAGFLSQPADQPL